MSIVWMVYFAGVANSLVTLFIWTGLMSLVLLAACALHSIERSIQIKWKMLTAFVFINFSMAALIPTEKTIYMMAGASIAQDIANNPKTIATMDKVYKLIDSKLDEQIKSLTDKEKK